MSELRKLTASEGMVYTNGEVSGREVYLGCNDSPENWWEIPETAVRNTEEECLNELV